MNWLTVDAFPERSAFIIRKGIKERFAKGGIWGEGPWRRGTTPFGAVMMTMTVARGAGSFLMTSFRGKEGIRILGFEAEFGGVGGRGG